MSESELEQSRQIDQLTGQRDRGPSAKSAAALESLLEEEKAQRKIERFFWIAPIIVLSSCILIKFIDSWMWTAYVILMSIVLLIRVCKMAEVLWIIVYLDRIFTRFSPSGTKKSPAEQSEEN
jgi:hypothetical protein